MSQPNGSRQLALGAIDVRRNPSRLNSDTRHMAGNRHTEEKYEHTNHSCNQKTPARVPRLRSSLGGGGGSGSGGPCAFRTVAQIERLYSAGALHSQAA